MSELGEEELRTRLASDTVGEAVAAHYGPPRPAPGRASARDTAKREPREQGRQGDQDLLEDEDGSSIDAGRVRLLLQLDRVLEQKMALEAALVHLRRAFQGVSDLAPSALISEVTRQHYQVKEALNRTARAYGDEQQETAGLRQRLHEVTSPLTTNDVQLLQRSLERIADAAAFPFDSRFASNAVLLAERVVELCQVQRQAQSQPRQESHAEQEARLEALRLENVRLVTEAARARPVPLRLHCPECHTLHVDSDEMRPHRTHACQQCGALWAPAVVETVGVRFLPGCQDGLSVAAPSLVGTMPDLEVPSDDDSSDDSSGDSGSTESHTV